jgi:glutathione synthase
MRRLDLLFVMDPLHTISVVGDSTWTLMLEAQARGWGVSWCTPAQLSARGPEAWARCAPFVHQPGAAPAEGSGAFGDRPLSSFDVVWMRKDPPFDMDYIFATYLLDLAPPTTVVRNHPGSIRSFNEKLFTLRFPELIVPTLLTRDLREAVAFAEAQPDRVVLKPWDGNGGRGVLVSRKGDPNLRSMLELLTGEGRHHIIVQRHIPEITRGDKRIVLIDGEPRGQILRVPGAGDHRGNMHAGATVEACDLSPRDREICDRLGPVLRAHGLLFVGIDVIGDWLTEINVTSPTGLQEIRRLSGAALWSELSDHVLALSDAARSGELRSAEAPGGDQ